MLVHVQSITTTMPEPTGFPDAEAILTVCRTAETLQRSTSTTSSTTSPQLSLGYTGREMALAFLAKGNADPHSIERRHARSAALKAIRMNPYSFSNWSSLGLLELSGYVVGDESKALGLNCIVKSLQLLAQSNDESVTVSQEEFVSQVSREIQSRIFSQMNDSESGVYRQGKFAELIRLKKAALAESLSMTRLEVSKWLGLLVS